MTKILSDYPTTEETDKPELFTSLVHSLRHLHHSQLAHVFYKIENFETRLDYFLRFGHNSAENIAKLT